MIELTNSEAWAVFVGAVLPVVISFLKSCQWERRWRFLLALACCAIAGAGTTYFTGQLALTKERVLVDIALVFLASQSVYKLWFEGSGIDKRLTGT